MRENIFRKENTVDKAQELYNSFLCAFKQYTQYIQAKNTSKKAKFLFNSDSAGQEYEYKAEMYFQRRKMHLQFIKQQLTQHFEKIVDTQQEQFNELFKTGRYKELLNHSKRLIILHILHSSISHEDTKEIVEKLDKAYAELENLKSSMDLYKYAINQIDLLSEKKFGNPGNIASFFCWLAIILAIALGIALLVIYCWWFGWGCDQLDENVRKLLKLCLGYEI